MEFEERKKHLIQSLELMNLGYNDELVERLMEIIEDGLHK